MDLPFDETFLATCHIPPERWTQRAALATLYSNLCAANTQDNLTRIVDEQDFYLRHVADSLLLGRALPEIMTADWRVADVGCGGGFPTLPLAWANPELRITGIEARGKKVAFVAGQIESLRFINASTLAKQAREAGRLADHSRQYHVILLRAVGPAGRMLREVKGLLSDVPGAMIVHYKTPPAVQDEMALAEREAAKAGLRVTVSEVVDLPCDAGKRQFLFMSRPG